MIGTSSKHLLKYALTKRASVMPIQQDNPLHTVKESYTTQPKKRSIMTNRIGAFLMYTNSLSRPISKELPACQSRISFSPEVVALRDGMSHFLCKPYSIASIVLRPGLPSDTDFPSQELC